MCQTPRQIKRGRDTKIPQSSGPPEKVGDEAVHKELGDRIEGAANTALLRSRARKVLTYNKTPVPWQYLMSQVLRKLVQETASTSNQRMKKWRYCYIDGTVKILS
ncbi:hypothetical protein Tco_1136585 [Tanacetum coccineum]